jgi:hypothetical protein
MLEKSLAACAALALYALGCDPAPGYAYEVVIDPAFSAPEAAYALDALQSWETILDGRMKVSSVSTGACSGADHQICIHAATQDEIVALGGEPSTLGRTMRSDMSDRADVYILSYADPSANVTRTIAHELGHAMSLEHTQRGTVMCFETGCAAPVPTCDDVAQWDSVRHGFMADSKCPNGGAFAYSGK